MDISTKTNGYQASVQKMLSGFGSPYYLFKVINKYGLEIRNNEYSEHAIWIGRTTEKIKDCLSILVWNEENPKYVQKQWDWPLTPTTNLFCRSCFNKTNLSPHMYILLALTSALTETVPLCLEHSFQILFNKTLLPQASLATTSEKYMLSPVCSLTPFSPLINVQWYNSLALYFALGEHPVREESRSSRWWGGLRSRASVSYCFSACLSFPSWSLVCKELTGHSQRSTPRIYTQFGNVRDLTQ